MKVGNVVCGVDIPSKRKPGVNPKYPFRQMTEGDSFFVLIESGESEADIRKNVSSIASQIGKIIGVRFTVRKEKDGLRVFHAGERISRR